MQNKDNDCIRYLMKEMDPSEELLMERAMMEDEDLLIEVESMRQTLQKLDKLPEVEPPSDVTDAIMEQAAEQAEKNRKSQKTFTPVLRYAVAATLALTVTAGGAWFYIGSEETQTNSPQTNIAATSVSGDDASTSDNASTDVAGMQLTSTNSSQNTSSPSTTAQSEVQPWIDRNDILRFEDQFSNQNESYRALIKNATQKLQLIEHPTQSSSRVNSLQLTGSGN